MGGQLDGKSQKNERGKSASPFVSTVCTKTPEEVTQDCSEKASGLIKFRPPTGPETPTPFLRVLL